MYHLTTFCFQTYQKDIENVEREWETVWEVFSELWTIPLSSHSTTHTNISTTHNSIPSMPTPTPPTLIPRLQATSTTLTPPAPATAPPNQLELPQPPSLSTIFHLLCSSNYHFRKKVENQLTSPPENYTHLHWTNSL